MADDDTETQTAPAPAPGPSGGLPPDVLTRLIQQLATQQTAPPTGTPDDGTKPSWTGLLGSVLGGGQAPGYQLRGGQADTSGNRALLNFGINTLLASGPHAVRPDVLSAVATGLQGAQESLGLDQRLAGAQAATAYEQNRQQQQDKLARIKEAIPLLTMQARLKAAGQLQSPLTPPAPGGGGSSVAGGSLSPFVATNLPDGVSPAEDQMVRTVIGEAANQGTVGQQAVASVIKNRMDAGKQNAQDVIFAANQFEPWNNPKTRATLEAIDPTSKQYQDILNNAVRPVMAGTAKDPTGGATHFFSPTAQKALGRDAPGWAQGQTPTVIGQHNFYKLPYSPQAPAPGQTAAAAPPGGQPPGAIPGQPVPPTPPGTNPNAQVQIPPPVVPTVQTAGPGAGNAPPDTTPAPPPMGPLDAPSREAFRAAHPFQPPPEQARTFSTALAPETMAGMAQQEQSAQTLVDQLTQQYKSTGDVKLLTDIANATDKRNTIISQNNTARQAQIDKGNTAYNTALAAHVKGLDDSFDKAHELQQQQQGSLANARLTDDMNSGRKVTDAMDTAATKANTMNSQLMQMYPLMNSLPQGITGAVLQAHPEWLGALKSAGIVSPDTADIVQTINGLTSYMATEMKPAGLGSMREYEFDAFRAALPNMLKSPAGQQKAMAFLLNMNDRIVQESQWMRGHFARPVPDASAPGGTRGAYNLAPDNITQMDKALGPIVPHYTGPTGDPIALQNYRAKQLPGRPFYNRGFVTGPNGQPVRDANGNVQTKEYLDVAPMPTGG